VKLTLEISEDDVEEVREFFSRFEASAAVRRTKRRNVDGVRPTIDLERFWSVLIMCLVTTQQRSGPDSVVARFLQQARPTLSLKQLRASGDANALVAQALQTFGLRRHKIIASQLANNLQRIDTVWAEFTGFREKLEVQHSKLDERTSAR